MAFILDEDSQLLLDEQGSPLLDEDETVEVGVAAAGRPILIWWSAPGG